MKPGQIHISDYSYDLPDDRIAQYPLAERDASKLLIMKDGVVSGHCFTSLPDAVPENTLLVWNNTRVIHARLIFFKESGACIEIFCLEPCGKHREINTALQAFQNCEWKCLIGNAKKWKSGALKMSLDGGRHTLRAFKIWEESGCFMVRFEWDDDKLHWADVLEKAGKVPLPPYISREAEADDAVRYQTLYAQNDGSVAAPTAGLHFSENVIKALENKGIQHVNLTLHVGAGTFKPVSSENIADHTMHTEQIILQKDELLRLSRHEGKILAVGTTSLRSLESFYWQGVKLLSGEAFSLPFSLDQWEVYESEWPLDIKPQAAFGALYTFLSDHHLENLHGETRLMIVPSYKVRTADILLTNFHQPRSTLLLLVAAFAGEEWRAAYAYAMAHKFRFLSYGDACLFFKKA